jgi:hypothetical protein
VADEAASAALQAQGALRGSEKLLEETHEWMRSQLDDRPTKSAVADVASSAAAAEVRAALADGAPLLPPAVPGAGAVAPAGGGPPVAVLMNHMREHMLVPLEVRIETLELSRRRVEAALEEISGGRMSSRELKGIEHMRDALFAELKAELGRKLPSLEQARTHRHRRRTHRHRRPTHGTALCRRQPRASTAAPDALSHRPLSFAAVSLSRSDSRGARVRRQVEALQQTLSAHVQRLPVTASFPHGRWTWTRGKLRAAGGRAQPPLLPWSAEKLNTSPATFGWQADRTFIEVLASGMYVVACTPRPTKRAHAVNAWRHFRTIFCRMGVLRRCRLRAWRAHDRRHRGRAGRVATRGGDAACGRLERPRRWLVVARRALARRRHAPRRAVRNGVQRGRSRDARRARPPRGEEVVVSEPEMGTFQEGHSSRAERLAFRARARGPALCTPELSNQTHLTDTRRNLQIIVVAEG